jgi:hypothetical protein
VTVRRATVLCAITGLGSVAAFVVGVYAWIGRKLP